jgi:hypothetical protein
MPLPTPIRFATDDGFQTEIAELPDQSLRVTVMLAGRSWAGEKAAIEEAAALAIRIRSQAPVAA